MFFDFYSNKCIQVRYDSQRLAPSSGMMYSINMEFLWNSGKGKVHTKNPGGIKCL